MWKRTHGLTYGRDADYVASIKTDQYSLESSAQDQYPANPAGVAHWAGLS